MLFIPINQSNEFLHFFVGDLRVHLGKSLPVLREVIERAVVRLGVAMLGAEDVGALAGHLDQADFL